MESMVGREALEGNRDSKCPQDTIVPQSQDSSHFVTILPRLLAICVPFHHWVAGRSPRREDRVPCRTGLDRHVL